MNSDPKGFTLIELLVVIAIIAVLSVVVILTLNPAELVKQARDSNRISDLNTLLNAVSIYLADAPSPSLGVSNRCYISSGLATTSCVNYGFFPTASGVGTSTTPRAVDSNGWVPINFNALSAGSPLGFLPLDPLNNDTYFYAYISTSTTKRFKLATRIESVKFGASGTADVVSTDGGVSTTTYYEVGTNLSL